jgi:hypothetical protein
MVIEQLGTTAQQTKDAIGPRDTTQDQILLRNREFVIVEEGSTIVEQQSIGTAFILNHSDNGVLGTSTLGDGTLGSYTTYAVVNPNNIFYEHFRNNFFYDSTNSTGVSWDTTNFRTEFSNNGEVRTLPIYFDYTEIATVKLTINTSGLRVQTQVDIVNFPAGREVNLT